MSGINAPIGIMGIILPIYTIIDMVETAENVWSDSCVCAMVDKDLKKESNWKSILIKSLTYIHSSSNRREQLRREVSIENKNEKKEEKKEEHYLRREFSYSNYSQSYALPENANQEKISAEVSDGVLKIEIPKVAKEEKKDDVKHIEVK